MSFMGPQNAFALRNPLAFPVGRTPGVDPDHIALSRDGYISAGLPLKFSGVASVAAPGFLRLDKGDLGTIVGSPTKVIDGAIGPSYVPSTSGTTNGTTVKFTTGTVSSCGEVTFAAIIRPIALSGNSAIACVSNGSTQLQLFFNNAQLNLYNGSYQNLGLSATAGTPYFVVVSTAYQSSPSVNVQNTTLLNLATGALTRYTASNGIGITDEPTVYIGSDWVPGNTLVGRIAALAVTRTFLNPQEQAIWAADPWSFWYPARTPIVAASSIGAAEADGSASVSGAGVAAEIGAGEADGAASVSGAAGVLGSGTGEADGQASVSGAGVEAAIRAGEADGQASVSGSGGATALAAGEADGQASVSGAGVAAKIAAGSAAGQASVSGAGGAFGVGTGSATGQASVSGAGVAIQSHAGEADGAASVSGAGESFFSPDVFPTLPGLGWPVHRRPTFRTIVAKHPNGGDVRTPLWTYPLWEFELAFEGLTASATDFPGLRANSLQILMGFFLAKGGAQNTFLFIDPDFNADTAVPLGTGDGTSTQFIFLRRMGSSIEPISWVTGIPTVYLNGVAQPGSVWALQQPNILNFATPPGAGVAITADVGYGFLCRFLDDSADFEQMMWNLWEAKSIKFRQVRSALPT